MSILAIGVALAASGARAEIREVRARLPAMPGPTGAERICEKRMIAPRTEGAAGCFIDERVTQSPGVLRYPCEGSGWVKAVFGAAVFLGRLDAGNVDLVLGTEFDFSDGCVWSTEQHLRGALSSPALNYTYSEAPKPGQRGCSTPCSARARVTFQ